jgi:hypothetical protein
MLVEERVLAPTEDRSGWSYIAGKTSDVRRYSDTVTSLGGCCGQIRGNGPTRGYSCLAWACPTLVGAPARRIDRPRPRAWVNQKVNQAGDYVSLGDFQGLAVREPQATGRTYAPMRHAAHRYARRCPHHLTSANLSHPVGSIPSASSMLIIGQRIPLYPSVPTPEVCPAHSPSGESVADQMPE